MTGVTENNQSWAIGLQCDWSNWIRSGLGHGRNNDPYYQPACGESYQYSNATYHGTYPSGDFYPLPPYHWGDEPNNMEYNSEDDYF